MIRIEIEAIDAAHCRAQLQELLRMYPSDLVQKFTFDTEQKFVLQPGGDVVEVTRPVTQPLVEHPDPTSPVRAAEVQFVAAADTPGLTQIRQEIAAEPAKRGRGRPKKNDSDAQPAVADNTGSTPAGNETPPAEGAQGSEAAAPVTTPPAEPAAAQPPTAQQMRASLQALIEAAPTTDEGQSKAREILAEFQVRKVGEVKPEQHVAIIAKAAEAMAAYKEGAA